MLQRILFLTLILLFGNTILVAQGPPIVTGCYIQCTGCVNVFYTNNTQATRGTGATLGFVYNTVLALNTSQTCPRVGPSIGTTVSKRCYGPATSQVGIEYSNYTINNCPLDSSVILLFLPLIGLSVYAMRRRVFHHQIV